jgi:hypothetical protein
VLYQLSYIGKTTCYCNKLNLLISNKVILTKPKQIRAGDEVRTRDLQLGRLLLYQLSYSRNKQQSKKNTVVGRGGFEPPKALPTDLQSAPFDRSGISPYLQIF